MYLNFIKVGIRNIFKNAGYSFINVTGLAMGLAVVILIGLWIWDEIWLPDTKQIIYFLIAGILAPLVVYKLMLEAIFVMAGDVPAENYWNLIIATGFGDFISTFCVSIPLLHFLTKFMCKRGLLTCEEKVGTMLSYPALSRDQSLELAAVAILAFLVNSLLGFTDYWFLNGILSLYVAMRLGFVC